MLSYGTSVGGSSPPTATALFWALKINKGETTKVDMENENLAQWQSADSLRRLMNTTGSTVVYFWRENKKIEGRYKIERRKNSDDNRLQYRAIDTDSE